jgi:hypothetical protein
MGILGFVHKFADFMSFHKNRTQYCQHLDSMVREEDGPEGCTFTSRNCSTDNFAAKRLGCVLGTLSSLEV